MNGITQLNKFWDQEYLHQNDDTPCLITRQEAEELAKLIEKDGIQQSELDWLKDKIQEQKASRQLSSGNNTFWPNAYTNATDVTVNNLLAIKDSLEKRKKTSTLNIIADQLTKLSADADMPNMLSMQVDENTIDNILKKLESYFDNGGTFSFAERALTIKGGQIGIHVLLQNILRLWHNDIINKQKMQYAAEVIITKGSLPNFAFIAYSQQQFVTNCVEILQQYINEKIPENQMSSTHK